MASITSIISLLVLLLATYCYSVPLPEQLGTSTLDYEFTTGKTIFENENNFTTGKTIVDNENKFTMRLISDDESTDIPNIDKDVFTTPFGKSTDVPSIHEEHMSFEHDKDELTTPVEHHEDVSRPSHKFENLLFTSSPMTFTSESSLSTEKTDLVNGLYTTMESSTEFNRRAIRPNQEESETETSTPVLSEEKVEITTNGESSFSQHESEPTSSVKSFGKTTGLLDSNEAEEKSTKKIMKSSTPKNIKADRSSEESSTPKNIKTDRSSEESTTEVPVKIQKINTISYVPGKIVTTKIYANVPSKTYVVSGNVQEQDKQLSQVQKLSIVNKEKSDN